MAIYVGQGIKGFQVAEVLEGLRLFKGVKSKKIQVDKGSEFVSKEILGHMSKKLNEFSLGLENQRTMRILNRLM